MPDTDLQPGEILAGKFRIEQVLGRGGMGVVVAATHIHLDERVAIKFLLPDHGEASKAAHRFKREARLLAGLRSPNTIQLYEYGDAEGLMFMVFLRSFWLVSVPTPNL